MNVSTLIHQLERKGIKVWADKNKLKIYAPKGVMTSEIQSELIAFKADILEYLLKKEHTAISKPSTEDISLEAIGRLIGGFSTTEAFTSPIIDPKLMAQKLKVTFRPLPRGYENKGIIEFRAKLKENLQNCGVEIVPWQRATNECEYKIVLPITKLKRTILSKAVKSDINAVIDVERCPSLLGKAKICVTEILYRLYTRFWTKERKLSVSKISQFISWAEENLHNMEDPTNTQFIVLTDLDTEFINPDLHYEKKIPIGVSTLVRTFSEIVIGVSHDRLSILNMNLSDSVFSLDALDEFVANSLIPKIYVPILPLSISRFILGQYSPTKSLYAKSLVKLGNAVGQTGLLPAGFKIDDVIKRKPHRDIVDWIAKGRTGVSYGFVAYAEPPRYEGDIEINAGIWETLQPVAGYSPDDLKQNHAGEWYVKLLSSGKHTYRQVPDIWLVSSRSGANKTKLDLSTDVVRVGLHRGRMHLQLPHGVDPSQTDIKPSYDLYVMIGIALGAALFAPKLIEQGMAMIHFHGYPSSQWFSTNKEYFTGVNNPSVPCGTYESGVFNFLGIQRLAEQYGEDILLAGLVEPDHGTNIIAPNLSYLLNRLQEGVSTKNITLGGKHFPSLEEKHPTLVN